MTRLIDVRDNVGATPEHEDAQRALAALEHELDAAYDQHDGSDEAQTRFQRAYTAWRAGLANANTAAYEAWGLTWGAQ